MGTVKGPRTIESSSSDVPEEIEDVLRAVAHAPSRTPPPTPSAGSAWGHGGRYVIDRKLGSGGMGSVYLATDKVLRREVALKVIDSVEGKEVAHGARVLREARAAAVEHERIARVYDVGEQDGVLFVAMEYVRGQTLRAWMRERTVTTEQAAGIALQIAEGLVALHDRGVIHRDLKPENIMLSPTGVKLLDFGLAKTMEEGDLLRSSSLAVAASGLTTQGPLCGTLGYMAPEQCEGAQVDPRTDLFALGVVVFELVEGRRPFVGATPADVVAATLGAPPALTDELWASATVLREVVERALARKQSQRWACATAVVSRLKLAPSAPSMVSLTPLEVSNELGESSTLQAGVQMPTHAHSLAPRRRTIAAVSLAVAAAGVVATIPWWRTRASGHRAAPKGMVLVDEGTLVVGQDPAMIDRQCAELGSLCDATATNFLASQAPSVRVTVPAFYLDSREVTNRELAEMLNKMSASLVVAPDEDDHTPRYVRMSHGVASEGSEELYLFDLEPKLGGVSYSRETDHYEVRVGREQWPATQATWFGARRYCASVGKRLPTEDEWEAASRGRADRPYPWGTKAPRCGDVVLAPDGFVPMPPACPALEAPKDVATAAADVTPAGIHDLGGNVAEWVDSAFVEGDRSAAPLSTDTGAPRVIRGGSFFFSMPARTSVRNKRPPSYASWDVGFRCAIDATTQKSSLSR